MDFVLGLLKGRKGSDAIWVMVDHLIKSTLFLPLKKKDFVLGLPRGRKGSDAIWVMVDHLIKSTFFLPMKKKDFVLGLPRGRKASDAIWVMVDQLIKSTLFLPMKKKWYGVPISIIFYRDFRFISQLWLSIRCALGTKVNLSIPFHP